jgi:transcriptional regulator with XRE-family HTH domain
MKKEPHPLQVTVGWNLQKARKKLGVTEKQMADLLYMSPRSYDRLESGQTWPRPHVVSALVGIGIPFSELLGEEPPMFKIMKDTTGDLQYTVGRLETCIKMIKEVEIPFMKCLEE